MKRFILFSLLFFVIITTGSAQKEKYQSLFIYNFTKYIKWPDSYNTNKFVIGVIGDSPIITSIKKLVSTKQKTSDGRVIEVKSYGSISEIDDCNILFVSEDVIEELSAIVTQVESKPILIVTDMPGMATQGSVINFVENDGKMRFELNASNASSRGLMVSGSLTSLAIMI